jgi:hypothetical protein
VSVHEPSKSSWNTQPKRRQQAALRCDFFLTLTGCSMNLVSAVGGQSGKFRFEDYRTKVIDLFRASTPSATLNVLENLIDRSGGGLT